MCSLTHPQVLQAVLERYHVPADLFANVCVIVDKIEKLPRDQIEKELAAIGVEPKTIEGAVPCQFNMN